MLEDDEILMDSPDEETAAAAIVHTVVKPNPVTSIMNFMAAGKAATAMLLHPEFNMFAEFIASKIGCTVGAVSQMLESGCATISTTAHVLRVPTRDDVVEQQDGQAKKKARLTPLGESTSAAKVLNEPARTEAGLQLTAAKEISKREKEENALRKREQVALEMPLVTIAHAAGLVQDAAWTDRWNKQPLTKVELCVLCGHLKDEKEVCLTDVYKSETNKALRAWIARHKSSICL